MILSLDLARSRIDLRLHAVAPRLAERYRAFAGASGPPRWTLEMRPGPAPGLGRLTGRAVLRDGLLRIEGAEALGWLDPSARRGEAFEDPMLVGVDGLVRAALATDVLDRGGCLLHAAAVEVEGLAHLAPGRSGAGKSTFAALAGNPLTDELAAVIPTDGTFEVHGTPWWRARAGAAALGAIYRLAWGGEGVVPLGRAAALRHLVANLVLPVDGPGERRRAFTAAAAMAAAAPFAQLAFRPVSDVDALLRRAAAAGTA